MKDIYFIMPAMEGGGAERVVSVLSKFFVENGNKVTICLFNNKTIEYNLPENVTVDTSFIKGKTGVAKSVERIKDIRKLMNDNPDAVFVSFFTMFNLYLLGSGIGMKRRIVVSERLDPRKSMSNKEYLFPLRNFLYKRAYKIVFQTREAKEFFPEKVQAKGVIIPNPLREGLPEPFEGVREKKIVSFGRLEPQKNYAMLLTAYKEFSKIHPDYTLVLYGQGKLENELKKQADECEIGDKVVFAGFSKNVHENILNAAAFVLPSDYEGLSNSMLEAMAIGLPVICTDCPPGGAKMFINSGENGLLVPVGDSDATCDAMCYMVEHPEETDMMGKRASAVKRELETGRICKAWEDVMLS